MKNKLSDTPIDAVCKTPIIDGLSLRNAVWTAIHKWRKSGDTYLLHVDVMFALAAFDYNTKTKVEKGKHEMYRGEAE
jgi:hypothetical protein